MEEKLWKKHEMYSNGYLNLSNVPGLVLFSLKEKSKCAHMRTHTRTFPEYSLTKNITLYSSWLCAKDSVCFEKSVYVSICALSPDMPWIFPLYEFSMTQSSLLEKLLMQKHSGQKAETRAHTRANYILATNLPISWKHTCSCIYYCIIVIKLQINVLLFFSGFWVIWNFDHKGENDS